MSRQVYPERVIDVKNPVVSIKEDEPEMHTSHTPFVFKGGIHPAYNKESTAGLPTRELPMPTRLVISMSQHLGAPAKPVVAVGDVVKAGQLLGEAAGMISAPVHAPAAGKIVAIETALSPMGRPMPAVVLEPDGSDEAAWMAPIDWAQAERRELVERIGAAGVVGMGGAGFPTRVKLSPPADKPIDTLILNGAECEPYLTGDHRTMVEQAREIRLGCEILRLVLNAKTVRVAIEDNKPDAILAIESALRGMPGDVGVTVLHTLYPQGSEKQQIFSVTGREVPRGGLPMDVGCVVENVGTTLAVWDAVVNGRPLTRRRITVTGDAVAEPANLLAPCGTLFSELVAACGGARGRVAKIISGGPMMGFAVASTAVPMTKTSSGLLLLSETFAKPYRTMACISCGRCIEACPMGLMPSELSQMIEADDIEGAEAANLMDCFECGACAFSCPARRPLVQHYRRAKGVVQARRMAAQQKK